MIKTYTNILKDDLIKKILEYLNLALKKNVWGSNNDWEQSLMLNSSIVLTHKIRDELLCKKIKNNIETVLDIDFEKEELTFVSFIYVWAGGSYITWHLDESYPYNGTIYLNEEWDSNDGGVFLYKDSQTKEIKGIEPTYNTMVVNSTTEEDPHNSHCVTCIVPGTIKKRVTIQWRTNKIDKIKKNIINYK